MMRVPVIVMALLMALSGVASAQKVVRVGHLRIGADAPFYLGIEKGWFKEKGIEIKFLTFASASKAMAPLAGGELEVVGGGISPGLFNSLARGWPLKMVMARSRCSPPNAGNYLMIRNDLKGQIKKFADLKGRKIAINSRGSALVYMMGKMLETEGMSLKDLDLVYMSWPNMGPALATKAIDGGAMVEPFNTLFTAKGYAYVWKRCDEVIKDPRQEVAVIFYNRDWADKNPQVAKDFLVVYLKGGRMLYEAMTLRIPKVRAEVIDVLTKYTRIKSKALLEKMTTFAGYQDPNGTIGRASIKDQQDFYYKIGMVVKKVDVDKFIDESYLNYALKQLGRYPVKR